MRVQPLPFHISRFKWHYYSVDKKRSGVGVMTREECAKNVGEVKRALIRLMSVKLETEGVMMNVVSGYTPCWH